MRVCQILLGDGYGGAERLFVDLSVELSTRGISVGVLCRPGFKGLLELEAAGLVYETISDRSSRDLLACYRINRFVRNFSADLVHAHLSRATRLASWGCRSVPVIASIHHYGSWRYYRSANFYMPISEYGVDFVKNNHVEDERIQRVSNFTRMAAAQSRTRASDPPFKLLAYGRFVEEKGFQDLIEACSLLKQGGTEFYLKLGGDGPYKPHIEALIKRYNLEQEVEICGWLHNVADELDDADLFVLPSRHEPFGLVLLEAMARRVPIVSTRSEGPGETFGANELWFCEVASPESMADSIRAALEQYAVSLQKETQAFEAFHRDYKPEAVVPAIINQYEAILRDHA